jgi:hypothetical protein
MPSIPHEPVSDRTPTTPYPMNGAGSRLRTVTGNRWPRKCACGCGLPIPRDPEVRYVVDFGAPRPYPAFLREHSPDWRGRRPIAPEATRAAVPVEVFLPASELPREAPRTTEAPAPRDLAHAEPYASPSPEAGRAWASGQLVFNAGSFESARSGFADYAREGETPTALRARVNRVLLEDLEQKVLALRLLHERLRERLGGPSFGDLVARGTPR